MKLSFLIPVLVLFFGTSLVLPAAEDEQLPDFSKGVPDSKFVKKAEIDDNETFVFETALNSKQFSKKLSEFLGENWKNRKLKTEEMAISAAKGRTMNAEINLSVFVNPKLPGVEIRKIHLKPKDAALPSTVEIAILRSAPQSG